MMYSMMRTQDLHKQHEVSGIHHIWDFTIIPNCTSSTRGRKNDRYPLEVKGNKLNTMNGRRKLLALIVLLLDISCKFEESCANLVTGVLRQ